MSSVTISLLSQDHSHATSSSFKAITSLIQPLVFTISHLVLPIWEVKKSFQNNFNLCFIHIQCLLLTEHLPYRIGVAVNFPLGSEVLLARVCLLPISVSLTAGTKPHLVQRRCSINACWHIVWMNKHWQRFLSVWAISHWWFFPRHFKIRGLLKTSRKLLSSCPTLNHRYIFLLGLSRCSLLAKIKERKSTVSSW